MVICHSLEENNVPCVLGQSVRNLLLLFQLGLLNEPSNFLIRFTLGQAEGALFPLLPLSDARNADRCGLFRCFRGLRPPHKCRAPDHDTQRGKDARCFLTGA
ncbi:unnamed protein product [Sphacelaria rigidula]